MAKKKEEDILLKRLVQQASKAMKDYGMVADGDRILIGLSGGKDSLALVEIMAERRKIFVPRFEVVACHVSVDNVPYKSDIGYLREFCESRGVKFIHATARFDEDRNDRRGPCFLCAWHRRKTLFRIAEEERCNKIAFGHHKDDLIETYLMNIIFQGATATMPPLLAMEKMDVTIIRPLARIREMQIQEMADAHAYRKQIHNCPHEHESNRTRVRKLMAEIEQMNPDAAGSLWGAMTNIQPDYLPDKP